MYIAIDDTDSRAGMCTTYLLTEIVKRSGLDLVGYPELVRLNPSIKHKTRGNGALCANLGHGAGVPVKAGSFHGKPVLSYPEMDVQADGRDLISLAEQVIFEMSELDEPETNPGIVTSGKRFDPAFYWKAVREELTISQAERFIRDQGGTFRKIKLGRGIIGAAAAIAWPGINCTYEMISYKYPTGETLKAEVKIRAAQRADEISGTFNNIDPENGYPAIFPKERTPVVYGIRGLYPDELAGGAGAFATEFGIGADRFFLYKSNQATDDHIIADPAEVKDGSSFSLEGIVSREVFNITGGHYFTYLKSGHKEIMIAAFEPTKEFRKTFSGLLPGDLIRVYGTYRDNCLNIEKMSVKALSSSYTRSPPTCSNCGAGMHSKGHNDYRCPDCGQKSTLPVYRLMPRSLSKGDYDVPVIARRHLSRPFILQLKEELA